MTFASKHMSFKMMFFTTEQRTFIVRTYFQTNSVAEVQERFRMTFPDREPPARNSILYNVRIVREFDLLKRRPAMVRSAVRHMESRVNLCIEREGQHVEGHVVP